MASSNLDDESDISDSDIKDYKEKPLEELKAGIYDVKGPNGTLRCPFCAGKKKQDYKYKDILQHATGVSEGSANRSAKQKANHLALVEYLETELVNKAEPLPQHVTAPVISDKSDQNNELYCWPWRGIVVNILNETVRKAVDSGAYGLNKFSKYKPLEVKIFWDDEFQIAQTVLEFDNDWTGFRNAMEFEKLFEADCHSKKEWIAQRAKSGPNIYGWFARADDYRSGGTVGEYLRQTGELKPFSDLVKETVNGRNKIVANLANVIDLRNENLNE